MKKVTQYKRRMAATAGIAAMSLSGATFAALPTAATTAFSDVQTDGLALIDLAWPVAVALVSASIVLGLFKKYAKKAAS